MKPEEYLCALLLGLLATETTAGQQAGGQASDHDGVPDLIERYHGTDPADSTSRAQMTVCAGGLPLVGLEFPRAADLTGLIGTVEVSQDLIAWSSLASKTGEEPWEVSSGTTTVVDDGSLVVLTHTAVPGGEHSFYRLRVALVPNVRALCVIADFSDQRLEDYNGIHPSEAFTDPARIQETLHAMEAHWAWMSVDSHIVQWDLIRIQLDEQLQPDAFGGWRAYRDAVAEKVKQEVDVADYDADGDSVIDTTFIVASSNDAEYHYLIGGASSNNGMNCFVDHQSSLSVRERHIGNFNHEASHNLGLTDLYGSHGNLGHLSLMSYSWGKAPWGFCAFDRYRLGWVTPEFISTSTAQISLRAAEDHLEAVIIPTEVATEYFLVEYRKRPETGFGSGGPQHNGLAIYHIDESKLGQGNNNVDPPLIMLEKPDGDQEFGSWPTDTDFWYPGNPSMTGPFYATPYYAPELNVFRIENIEYTAGGMQFDVVIMSHDVRNLIRNADFTNGLTYWAQNTWSNAAVFTHHPNGGPDGSAHVSIEVGGGELDDASFVQKVTGLEAGKNYTLSGWIKGTEIEVPGEEATGANVSVLGGFIHSGSTRSLGTFGWRPFSVTYAADNDWDDVAARLGFYGSTARGSASYDRISLVELP